MTTADDLDRRTSALETAQNDTTQTLRWTVSRLGRISAVQDEHTLRLERIESDLGGLRRDVEVLKADVSGLKMEVGALKMEMRELKAGFQALRDDLPGIISDAIRDVLREKRK